MEVSGSLEPDSQSPQSQAFLACEMLRLQERLFLPCPWSPLLHRRSRSLPLAHVRLPSSLQGAHPCPLREHPVLVNSAVSGISTLKWNEGAWLGGWRSPEQALCVSRPPCRVQSSPGWKCCLPAQPPAAHLASQSLSARGAQEAGEGESEGAREPRESGRGGEGVKLWEEKLLGGGQALPSTYPGGGQGGRGSCPSLLGGANSTSSTYL